ncbi:MAG: DegV family protein [Eubacteriaceae bacterium]|nr:DegV family protein [Eubacteriaceae bacterium]
MKNKKVHIITDSGSDLMGNILDGKDIEILRMPVTANGVEYTINDENDLMNLYRLMREGVVFSTAHASYYDILSAFERCAKEEIPCVFVGLSSGLTSQHNAAMMAAREVREEYPDCVLEVIDSASATMGYGKAVLAGYEKAQAGAGIEEVVETIIDDLNHTEHLFSVQSLEFLVRGGRLSKMAGAVGEALSIKPIINIDDAGKLVTQEKVRGDKKLRNRLVEISTEALKALEGQDVWIVEGENGEMTKDIIERINKCCTPNSIRVYKMGPVISVHTGPDVLGIIYNNPQRNKNIRPMVHEISLGEIQCRNRRMQETALERA